jgi:hypothetical protein
VFGSGYLRTTYERTVVTTYFYLRYYLFPWPSRLSNSIVVLVATSVDSTVGREWVGYLTTEQKLALCAASTVRRQEKKSG